jgi:hypothetical protein
LRAAPASRFVGHRLSVDLDSFTPDLFDEEALLARVQAMPDFSLVAKAPHTIHAVIHRTKVSFLGYPYPALFPPARFLDVPVADPRDIACMKVTSIASRGTKHDFIDLYMASQRFGLAEILNWFVRKYTQTGYNRIHILKSLTFFGDAEKDPMPAHAGSACLGRRSSVFQTRSARLALEDGVYSFWLTARITAKFHRMFSATPSASSLSERESLCRPCSGSSATTT